jgi:hypothetical protein
MPPAGEPSVGNTSNSWTRRNPTTMFGLFVLGEAFLLLTTGTTHATPKNINKNQYQQ